MWGSGPNGVDCLAQAQLHGPEQLAVGGIDEFLGHVAEGLLAVGPQPVHQALDACFAGRRRSRARGMQHGCRLAVKAERR
jgi:hypothetical protein